MRYRPLTAHNVMEMWVFDTCNFRCGYCSLVTSGDVTRVEQLAPYRDEAFIDRLVAFFAKHRPKGRPWAVLATGGEPLMMPNVARFALGLGRQGDCVGFYTNNSLPPDKVFPDPEAFKYLAYIECSFHPDWHIGHLKREQFFAHVRAWVDRGVPTLVRFVGAPQILDLLSDLEERSIASGAGFLPTALFDPGYPRSYTPAERMRLANAMSGYSSLIQLDGGVDVHSKPCEAAGRLFAVRLHKGGDITPCISTSEPVLGNIFAGTLSPRDGTSPCFKPDNLCTCDIHFQQHVVQGVDDSANFADIVSGRRLHSVRSYAGWKEANGITTTDEIWCGQGVRTETRDDLLRVAPKVEISRRP